MEEKPKYINHNVETTALSLISGQLQMWDGTPDIIIKWTANSGKNKEYKFTDAETASKQVATIFGNNKLVFSVDENANSFSDKIFIERVFDGKRANVYITEKN